MLREFLELLHGETSGHSDWFLCTLDSHLAILPLLIRNRFRDRSFFVNLEFVNRAAAVPKTGGAAKASQGGSADQRVAEAKKDTPIGYRSVAISTGGWVGGTERMEDVEVAVRIDAIDDAIAIRASVGGGRIHGSVVAKSQTRVGIGSIPIIPACVCGAKRMQNVNRAWVRQ